MAGKTIGLDGALEDYYRQYGYREPAPLAALRQETTAALGSDAQMQIGPEQGAFLAMIVALMGARRIVEFGTFTGYSALAMTLGSDARITCADVSEAWTAIARRHWALAGVGDRIDLHLDGGDAVISRLLALDFAGRFDLAFIDADKAGYDRYYEGALNLLRPGGLVLVDNVLWGGDVVNPAATDADTEAIRALNRKIAADARVDLAMLPLCDGLTMARKR